MQNSSQTYSEIFSQFYSDLLLHFGKQFWWPGDTPWEIAVGAVLTQNTNWKNVEKAITNLKSTNSLGMGDILSMPANRLAQLIRPSGYFNVKAVRLRNLAKWWSKLCAEPPAQHEVRESLLQVVGIGKETADSIMLYAFNIPSFVVDAYTKRILTRHGIVGERSNYEQIKTLLEANIPKDLEVYQEYHALIVALGKSYCKTKPQCKKCPLSWHLGSVTK